MADRHRQSRQNLSDFYRIDQLMVWLYHIKSALEPEGVECGGCRRRLRIPDGGRLRWRVKIGAREFDVRDDHYDSRQWLAPELAGFHMFQCQDGCALLPDPCNFLALHAGHFGEYPIFLDRTR